MVSIPSDGSRTRTRPITSLKRELQFICRAGSPQHLPPRVFMEMWAKHQPQWSCAERRLLTQHLCDNTVIPLQQMKVIYLLEKCVSEQRTRRSGRRPNHLKTTARTDEALLTSFSFQTAGCLATEELFHRALYCDKQTALRHIPAFLPLTSNTAPLQKQRSIKVRRRAAGKVPSAGLTSVRARLMPV